MSTEPNSQAEMFVSRVRDRIEFWNAQSLPEYDKLIGVAFSILALIDNVSDIENCQLNINGENVSGVLHEILFPGKVVNEISS